ncbi:DUF3179 domain-containing protein [Jiulongibacter sp. NS-SX5]|uniref:DUF3179 domain-containing protein n=1 Tax=Jiulongibacter sp. NS-SX5 TaxID=3463854 RepID=UPI004057F14D
MRWTFLICWFLLGCNQATVETQPMLEEDSEWSVPIDEVRDGGVGRDGIPSIDRPMFSKAADQQVLFDHELVTGIVVKGVAVAYPHKILDYHEIVNTDHGGFAYAISFCPLTGTSLVYPRELNGQTTTYGVSGLLFNSNLILYDRASESLWSQMLLSSINGEFKDQEIPFYQTIETTWATWKSWYPESLVLDPPNQMPRSYDEYAYGGYRENHDLLLFPPKNDFTGFPRKERILGVVNEGRMYPFRFNQFQNGVGHLTSKVGNREVLVFGNAEANYLFANENKTEQGAEVVVKQVFKDQRGGKLFEDTQGNIWSVNGEAITGQNKGQRLRTIQNYIGYSFAMAAFYPNDFFER